MKKIILSLSAILLLATVPSFAQNTFKKAKDTNAVGRSATQSQSETDARNIGNQSWDGSAKGSGTPSSDSGKTIDIIGGNENIDSEKDEKSSFDAPKAEDATPWKDLLTGIVSTIMGAMAMLAAAALVTYFAKLHEHDPTGMAFAEKMQRIAQYLAVAAIATLTAAIAMATVLMAKYQQHLLGGLWLGCATLGMASGIAMVVGTSKLRGKGWYMDSYNTICTTLMITTLAVAAIGVGGGGVLAYKSYQQLNQQSGNHK